MSSLKNKFLNLDPRIPIAFVLFSYLVLGLTVLGFNRTPLQILTTSLCAILFEFSLALIFKREKLTENWKWFLSPLITSFSLSFLLNYSHDFALLFVPIFFSIGSKYLFQLRQKHFFNPALFGVSCSLLFSSELITASPAYQWYGIASMSLFVLMMGLLFVIPKVNRHWLVLSFLITYTLQTGIRAFIMRHHLPFETLFLGTLSSPPFLIFTFFMITDPPTSPNDRKTQILIGVSIALVDLLLHLRQSYYTFFYAALLIQATRFLYFHFQAAYQSGLKNYSFYFFKSGFFKRPLLLGLLAIISVGFYRFKIHPHLSLNNLPWRFEKIPGSQSGLNANENGHIYELLDPRVQNVAKWVLSVGDAAAVGDIDNDGKLDLFLTNVLKKTEDRATLYRNTGNYKFERFEIPELDEIVRHPETHGLITNAIFVDYDNTGVNSLFLTVAFGHPILLKNQIKEKGVLKFKDVSAETGLDKFYTNSIAASFADFNKDGLIDLLILNVWPEILPDYETPRPLNLFHLPAPEFAEDQRMFNFMHNSWNLSNNGGKNLLFLQTPSHHFQVQDADKWGLPETRWSLAVGIADLNHDGWPDIYIANDFGPDDLYYNLSGQKFENYKGTIFGSIGKDTYKGMNVTIADFDRTGWFGIYVSNVHHAFQAEGSLLWTFKPSSDAFHPDIIEKAASKGVLNEDRFGWGGVSADFDNNGWLDIAQANGMVDDMWDKKFDSCPDYWYVNEKVARSPPAIHRYANRWGDLRGYCIYGHEQNRVYLNLGKQSTPQFVDVASMTGVTELTNSRGVAAADFENRGRMDLIFTHQFSEPTLYKNVLLRTPSDAANNWVKLDLESENKKCNHSALGSTVILHITKNNGDRYQLAQEKQLVSGLSAQSDTRLHFGLGDDVKAVSADINWCYGLFQQVEENIKINQIHKFILKNGGS